MKMPRFYYMDLNNYTDEFLKEIILWQKQEIEELKEFTIIKRDIILESIENKFTMKEIDDIFQKQIEILKQKYNHRQFLSSKQGKLYGIMEELNKIRKILREMKK